MNKLAATAGTWAMIAAVFAMVLALVFSVAPSIKTSAELSVEVVKCESKGGICSFNIKDDQGNKWDGSSCPPVFGGYEYSIRMGINCTREKNTFPCCYKGMKVE